MKVLSVCGALLPVIACGCTTLYETTGLMKGKAACKVVPVKAKVLTYEQFMY